MTARLITELHAESAGPAAQALDAGRWEEAAAYLVCSRPEGAAGRALRLTEAVLRAQARLNNGHPEAALAEYRAALSIAPDFYRLHNLVGNLFLDTGNYPDAERSYRESIRLNPDYAAGYCNLGAVRLARGDTDTALTALARATQLNPEFAYAWRVTADAHLARGDAPSAIRALMRVAACDPEDPEPCAISGELHDQLGEHAAALSDYREAVARGLDDPGFLRHVGERLLIAGQAADAEPLAQRVVDAEPSAASGWLLLGNIQQALGRPADAVTAFRRAAVLDDSIPELFCNLGNSLCALKRYTEAVAACRRAEGLAPDLPEVHNNLATALAGLGEHPEALAHCDRALALRPGFMDALLNRGGILQLLRRFDDATNDYLAVLQAYPDHARALCDLARCEYEKGDYTRAIELARRSLAVEPDRADAWLHLANAQEQRGLMDDALESASRVIALAPDMHEGWNNYGHLLMEHERFPEAIRAFRRALDLNDGLDKVWSNLLFCMSGDPGTPSPDYLCEARRAGAHFLSLVDADWPAPTSRCDKSKQLRVGLLSGDLRNHPVGYFLENILPHLRGLELYAYETRSDDRDTLTARIKPRFQVWRQVEDMSDRALATRIREDELDILIDLSGHTAYNRAPVFAWKPAPVQAAWLGYFASTGIPGVDWVLTDPVTSPPGAETDFSERLWRLPVTRLCFSPPAADDCPPVAPAPAESAGRITFGCFQRLRKINDRMIAAWARILTGTPDSRLILKGNGIDSASARARLQDAFRRLGVAPERILCEGTSTRQDYFAQYGRVDIMLDTFPFPGGTTTCEALWMGVPTLTLAGKTMLERQGASLMCAVGLPQWVTVNVDDYVARAITLARDIPGLAALRRGLREQARLSPLMDARRFAADFEDALRGMQSAGQP